METIQEVLRQANTRLTKQAANIIDMHTLTIEGLKTCFEQERNISDTLAREVEELKLANTKLTLALNSYTVGISGG